MVSLKTIMENPLCHPHPKLVEVFPDVLVNRGGH